MTCGGRVIVIKDSTMVTVTGPGARSVISDLNQQFLSHSQEGNNLSYFKRVMNTF